MSSALSNLKNPHPKQRKRIGRGIGSGTGKTAGKGHKGQLARSGGGTRPGFEGGQLPLFQRLPKVGFNPVNKKVYAIVTLNDLDKLENGTTVDEKFLLENKIINKLNDGVKVLANGELSKKLTVKVTKVTKGAKEQILKTGGTVEDK